MWSRFETISIFGATFAADVKDQFGRRAISLMGLAALCWKRYGFPLRTWRHEALTGKSGRHREVAKTLTVDAPAHHGCLSPVYRTIISFESLTLSAGGPTINSSLIRLPLSPPIGLEWLFSSIVLLYYRGPLAAAECKQQFLRFWSCIMNQLEHDLAILTSSLRKVGALN